jgi:hypothetical protein
MFEKDSSRYSISSKALYVLRHFLKPIMCGVILQACNRNYGTLKKPDKCDMKTEA